MPPVRAAPAAAPPPQATAPMSSAKTSPLAAPPHFVRSRASSSSRVARDGLKTPQEQNRLSTTARLIGRPPPFLHPVDHLLGERHADHAVPAHRRQRQDVAVRQMFGLSFEAERIPGAVTRNAGRVAARDGAVDRRRDVDAQAEVGFANRLGALLRGLEVVEHRGRRARRVEPLDHLLKSGSLSRFQCESGDIDFDGRYAPPCRESPRFTGLNCMRDLEEPPQLGHRIFIVLSAAGNRKDDVVVAEALRVAEPMQRIRHGFAISTAACTAA